MTVLYKPHFLATALPVSNAHEESISPLASRGRLCTHDRSAHTAKTDANVRIRLKLVFEKYEWVDWVRGSVVVKALRYKPGPDEVNNFFQFT
jgi:hypothetical protein